MNNIDNLRRARLFIVFVPHMGFDYNFTNYKFRETTTCCSFKQQDMFCQRGDINLLI